MKNRITSIRNSILSEERERAGAAGVGAGGTEEALGGGGSGIPILLSLPQQPAPGTYAKCA